MSDSDSESEGDKIRRTKRSLVVKFKFDDTESSTDESSDGPCTSQNVSASKRSRKLPSTDDDSDDVPSTSKKSTDRRTSRRLRTIYVECDSSDDDSWCPDVMSRANDSEIPSTSGDAMTTATATTSTAAIANCESSTDSDSSDVGAEKCPICLHTFRDQEIGVPNVCDHSFCAPCIDEWSGNVQTCPIDRQPFTSIRIRSRYSDGVLVREIPVKVKSNELEIEFDVTNCEVCSRADREETMLLCDSCNAGYHMECLEPPLTEVPSGSWYCDYCFDSADEHMSDDDIAQLTEELRAEIGIMETRLRVHRAIPAPRITRTRQSERIRATIRNRRRGALNDVIENDEPTPGKGKIT